MCVAVPSFYSQIVTQKKAPSLTFEEILRLQTRLLLLLPPFSASVNNTMAMKRARQIASGQKGDKPITRRGQLCTVYCLYETERLQEIQNEENVFKRSFSSRQAFPPLPYFSQPAVKKCLDPDIVIRPLRFHAFKPAALSSVLFFLSFRGRMPRHVKRNLTL